MKPIPAVKVSVANFLLLSLLLALGACGVQGMPSMTEGATPHLAKGSSDIIGGATDNDDPAVAVLYNKVQGYLCTGTLIADRVFLTAGHCTQPDTNPADFQIGGGSDPFHGATWVADVSEVHTNPGYSPDPAKIGIADTGILILSASVAGVTPMPWLSTRDDSKYAVGMPFKAVGYGITSQAASSSSGTKRTVQLSIQQVGTDAFQYGSSSKNTCSGDSGGPAIETINGVDTVIGTVSYGDQNCAQYGVDMRVDDEAGFIGQFASGSVPAVTPTPNNTPNGSPTPAPTGTPGGNGASGGSRNPTFGGCTVGGNGSSSAAGSLALLAGLAMASVVARRRR